MHRNFTGLGIVFLFMIMLVCPKAVFAGASEGLLLWFQIILPTLFPFVLITNLLLRTGNMRYISSAFGKLLSRLFAVSSNGSFSVIVGFLCGYPMGAKTAADLTEAGYISENEGKYLLSFCNNTSPVFILNFIVWKTLKDDRLLLPTLLILMASPVLVSFFTRGYYLKGRRRFYAPEKNYVPAAHTGGKDSAHFHRGNWSFREIDNCIMDSFETLVKVGGYIILFSVILSLCRRIPFSIPAVTYTLPLLEVTNGIVMLGNMDLPLMIRYPAILGLTSFGGLCAAAQTQCMVQNAGLPTLPYIIEKLAAALTASLLGILYIWLF